MPSSSATGGNGAIFGKSTNSVVCTGSAQSALYQQGAHYANGEFIQVHPTAIPGEDKLRLMSESARGEGGRVWVPRDRSEKRVAKSIPEADRYYFLEERYPKYGNLVPRDIATREIFKIVYEDNMGIDGQPMVYLDLTHLSKARLQQARRHPRNLRKIRRRRPPRPVPMKIFPGMHYTMGGLWVDFDQQTNIPGIFAAGEADYSIHGANRLGANSLLSCIYAGLLCRPQRRQLRQVPQAPMNWRWRPRRRAPAPARTQRRVLLKSTGKENPFKLWRELGETMTEHATIVRYNAGLAKADAKIVELLDPIHQCINLSDKSQWANTSFAFGRQLKNMLELSRVVVQGAAQRP